MNGTRILARVIPLDPLSAPLPDGDYALICFKGLYSTNNRFGFTLTNPFPWWVSVVHFSDGLCDDRYSGSNVADILARGSLDEVLIIDNGMMTLSRRRELAEMLAVKNIELIDV